MGESTGRTSPSLSPSPGRPLKVVRKPASESREGDGAEEAAVFLVSLSSLSPVDPAISGPRLSFTR